VRPRWLRRGWIALTTAGLFGALASPAFGFGVITSWGVPGSADGEFGEVSDVAVDSDFTVYATDRFNNRVQVFSPLGAFLRKWSAPESFGLALSGGNVFLSDFNGDAMRVFTTQGAPVRSWGSAGSATDPGQPHYFEPWGVDVGPDGNVYVADSVNGRIVVTSPTGAFVGEMGVGMLSSPFGVAVDAGGSAFVADTGHDRIIRLDPGGTFFDFGSTGSGDGQFNDPWDVAFDPNGDLLVLDRVNNRVQRLTTGGTFISKFGTPGGGLGQLASPEGLDVDAAGNVYVADSGNGRIVRYGDTANLATSLSASRATLTVGETVSFSVRVANAGPDPSRLVSASLTLPPGATLVSATSTQGSCGPAVPVTCSLGTIPSGVAAGVTVTLRATGAAALPVSASVTSPTFDADPTDNAAQASATAQVAPAPPPGPPPPPPPPPPLQPIVLKAPAVTLSWRQSRLVNGVLVVRGTAPVALRARISLRRSAAVVRGQKPPEVTRVASLGKGEFTVRVPLPASLAPGAYRLSVAPVSAGVAQAGTRAVSLAGPREGVVAQAQISAFRNGPPALRLRAGARALFARFTFSALPKAGRLTASWKPPRGAAGAAIDKPRQRQVASQVASSTPLLKGVWTCTLRAGGKVVKRVSVRVG
jgi:uncharacterized repeat protein (TIGR01451 family)